MRALNVAGHPGFDALQGVRGRWARAPLSDELRSASDPRRETDQGQPELDDEALGEAEDEEE